MLEKEANTPTHPPQNKRRSEPEQVNPDSSWYDPRHEREKEGNKEIRELDREFGN